MADTADLGDEQQRRRRVPAPSARITCADNAAELELLSHRQAQAATRPTESTTASTTKRKPTAATEDTPAEASTTVSKKKRLTKGTA